LLKSFFLACFFRIATPLSCRKTSPPLHLLMPAKQSSSSNQSHLAPIPDGLQRQLEAFRQKLWRIKISEALLAGCSGLIASFLFVFLLDRFFETPTTIRLITLLAGTSLFTVFVAPTSRILAV